MQGLVYYSDDSPPASPQAGPSRLRNGTVTEPPPPIIKSKKGKDVEPLPENLTHTAQSDLPSSHLDRNQFEGMTEDEIFQIATRPDDIDGLNDWGIPSEADPAECSDQLKAKVAQFLRLKYTSDQHINTSLLASSSFANPHIYSKLVEFVDLDERATQFPSNGWLTRQNLEQLNPRYGPKALSEEQKRRQEAKKREQEGRSSIQFAPGRKETKNSRESKGTKRDRAGGWDERDTRRKR